MCAFLVENFVIICFRKNDIIGISAPIECDAYIHRVGYLLFYVVYERVHGSAILPVMPSQALIEAIKIK